MVICLERGADLHMAQLMPLPPTVSCSSKIQIGFAFLVPAHLGSPGQRAVKRMYVFNAYFCQAMYGILWFQSVLCKELPLILNDEKVGMLNLLLLQLNFI